MEPEDLMSRVYNRGHITVVGSKEMLDEAAVKYGWFYSIKPLCADDAMVIAAVDFHTNQIFCIIGTLWELQNIRETVINYSRYGKLIPLDSPKLEALFFPEYESNIKGKNPRILAENVSHYCSMLELGFGFGTDLLEDMLVFCQLNELYEQANQIQSELDKTQA